MYKNIPEIINLEYSIKFDINKNLNLINNNLDRFTIWIKSKSDFYLNDIYNKQFYKFIPQLNNFELLPTRNCGLSIESNNKDINYRLYLHQKLFPYKMNHYFAVNWDNKNNIKYGTYEFNRGLFDKNGNSPIDILKKNIQEPYISKILSIFNTFYNDKIPFFYKYNDNKIIGVDFVFIPSKSFNEIINIEGINNYKNLQIKHLQINFDKKISLSFYISSDIKLTELNNVKNFEDIKYIININSMKTKYQMNVLFQNKILSIKNNISDLYDSCSINLWKKILGNNLHYHAGIFDIKYDNIYEVFDNSIRELYKYIGENKTIIDIGCGWGGSVEQIGRELNCEIVGVTNSKKQYKICKKRLIDVIYDDAESIIIPGIFDIALLIESLSHIINKKELLTKLYNHCNSLIMRVNCNKNNENISFGNSMIVITPENLKNIIIESGWTIIHWNNIRYRTKDSCDVWLSELKKIPINLITDHLKILYDFCIRVSNNKELWCNNNPLIEVVAIKNNYKIELYNFNNDNNDNNFKSSNFYIKDNHISYDNIYYLLNYLKKNFQYYNNGIIIEFTKKEILNNNNKNNIIYKFLLSNIMENMNFFKFTIYHSSINNNYIKSNPDKTIIGYLDGINKNHLNINNTIISPQKGRICIINKNINYLFNKVNNIIFFIFEQFTKK